MLHIWYIVNIEILFNHNIRDGEGTLIIAVPHDSGFFLNGNCGKTPTSNFVSNFFLLFSSSFIL